MAKKYLVTGGLGFIGAAVTRALVLDGAEVRVLDNSFRGARERLGELVDSVEICEGDIRDSSFVDQSVAGVDAVCHLAYINGTSYFYERPQLVLEVAVKGMMNVLDSCLKHDVGELSLASSSEVYQTPPSIPTAEEVPLIVPDVQNPRYSYGGGKIICELLAINYGRQALERVLIFRPHNVYGPNMGWKHVIPEFAVRMQRECDCSASTEVQPFQIQGDGTQTRAFIYIDDFVAGVMTVLKQGQHQQIYHIGTMEERTILEVAEGVAGALGINIELVPSAEPAGATNRRCPDTGRLQSLGFSPAISFEEGLQKTVDWYRDHLHLVPENEARRAA